MHASFEYQNRTAHARHSDTKACSQNNIGKTRSARKVNPQQTTRSVLVSSPGIRPTNLSHKDEEFSHAFPPNQDQEYIGANS